LAGGVNRAYRVALFCWACPLILGGSIFLLWLVTHWDWLTWAGVVAIWFGILLFVSGAVSLFIAHRNGAKAIPVSRGKLWLSTVLCAGLLLSNFLVARIIVGTVDDILGITKNHGVLGPDASGQIKLSGWRATKPQALGFSRPFKQDGGAQKASLHVKGRIDGTAVLETMMPLNGFPHTISGDVDWRTSGEFLDYVTMILTYRPTDVTAGQLTFELTFD
jgi:hypothetical protein